MIIGTLLKYVADKVVTLATKSEDNPKKANALTGLLGSAGTLWLSDSTRIALADTLTALADVLRGL